MKISITKIVLGFVVAVTQVSSVQGIVTGEFTYKTIRVDACAGQYYNSLQMACSDCPSGSTPSLDVLDGEGNSVECACSAGYFSSNGLTPCTACPSDAGSNRDGTACVTCGTNTTGKQSSGLCGCSSNSEILVESDAAGNPLSEITCLPCPDGTFMMSTDVTINGAAYKADSWSCQACPDPLMTMTSSSSSSYSCSCPSGYTLVGDTVIGAQSCALTSTISSYSSLLSTVSSVTFANGQTVSSSVIKHYFLSAVERCINLVEGVNEDMTACQALANLCVLTMYDDTTSGICDTFNTIVSSRSNYRFNNWATDMPWLTYGTATASQICLDHSYKTRMMLDKGLMAFYVAKYSLNGTWLGFTPLDTLFGYCSANAPDTSQGGGDSSSTQFQVFGNSKKSNLLCALSKLLDANSPDQMFFELYLLDKYNMLLPVPVRIVNLKQSDGTTYNTGIDGGGGSDLCGATDVLVRRFYLTDISTGIEDSASAYLGTGRLAPTVLRYASTISLAVSMNKQVMTKIYTPVLSIEYSEVYSASIKTTTTVTYTVQGEYYKPMSQFFDYVHQFFIAGMVLAGCVWFLRYRNWSKRNTRNVNPVMMTTTTVALGDINITALSKIVLLAAHSWVIVFFPFLVLICWYLFVFFKLQSYPDVMLPPVQDIYSTTSEYFLFVASMHILAFFQLAYVLFLILRQSYADTFFIDWEPAGAKADGGNGRVSVWRSILVANEWAELLTRRRTDIRLTLFFILFLYYSEDLQYDASQQPELNDKSADSINPVLRFATSVWWWILFSSGQYYFNYLFYERFISEPPEQVFVDLCTIAKISLLVLDEDFHGYYLHCRSPHQFADGTMIELLDMLQKEEAGLTVDRSLDGAPKDVQVFEVFMSGEWRSAFDKSFHILKHPASVGDLLHQGRRGRPGNPGMGSRLSGDSEGASILRSRGPGGGANAVSDRSIKAWREVTTFLQQFVDNNFGRAGLRRTVREPTYVESLCGIPPELTAPEQMCVFFTDRFNHFTKLMFLGIETDMIVLDIMVFTLCDLWFHSPATAALLVFLVDYLLAHIRESIGKAVIARKTLIDERFLV